MLNFKEDGCEVYEDLIPKEALKLLHKYTFSLEVEEPDSARWLVPGDATKGEYSNPVMETIGAMIQPLIEKRTGLELSPTYTYYRKHSPGNSLLNHIDRHPCEISVTILLDAQYKGDKGYRWKIFADPEPYRNNETLDHNNLPNNKGVGVKQTPGDGLIYRGSDIPHWREKFVGEEGSYHTQLFCHFIDKNGPHYPKWKYDSRPGLGYPASTRKY